MVAVMCLCMSVCVYKVKFWLAYDFEIVDDFQLFK